MNGLRKELEALKERNLHRVLRALSSAPEAETVLDGRPLINFASNNYLDLAMDDRLRAAVHDAVERWGVGATASRLLGGNLALHERLEQALAKFKGTEAAAVFPSGYHVNVGLLPALLGPEDTVLLDRYAHASLVDGARLSRARLRVFRHNDPEDLERALARLPKARQVWIVTESVFSMDGDAAPLKDIVSLAGRYGARTYVDEAHATGLWGPDGRGLLNALGLERQVDVCMGTLSKALGSQGGFACGSRDLVEWIHNRCRSFIYSTALLPSAAAAALAALEIGRAEPARREKAFALAARLRRALAASRARAAEGADAACGPIVPFEVGDEATALALSRRLWDQGIFAPAIRPPTVPKGTARLRFSVTAGHSEEQIDRAGEAVRRFFAERAPAVRS